MRQLGQPWQADLARDSSPPHSPAGVCCLRSDRGPQHFRSGEEPVLRPAGAGKSLNAEQTLHLLAAYRRGGSVLRRSAVLRARRAALSAAAIGRRCAQKPSLICGFSFRGPAGKGRA